MGELKEHEVGFYGYLGKLMIHDKSKVERINNIKFPISDDFYYEVRNNEKDFLVIRIDSDNMYLVLGHDFSERCNKEKADEYIEQFKNR